MSGRLPDYKLGIMNKATGERNPRAGGAWIDEETGYIRIVLDYGISIPPGPNVVITLFPNDDQRREQELR